MKTINFCSLYNGIDNSSITRYLYEYDKVILEVDGKGTQLAKNVEGINLISRTAVSEEVYYLYNGHADVTALLDEAGTVKASYCYDAFGNQEEETGTLNNPYRYAGYQYDNETGLYYLESRMYDPGTARFLQEDTYSGDINDPLSLTRYTYCSNEPIRYIDRNGHLRTAGNPEDGPVWGGSTGTSTTISTSKSSSNSNSNNGISYIYYSQGIASGARAGLIADNALIDYATLVSDDGAITTADVAPAAEVKDSDEVINEVQDNIASNGNGANINNSSAINKDRVLTELNLEGINYNEQDKLDVDMQPRVYIFYDEGGDWFLEYEVEDRKRQLASKYLEEYIIVTPISGTKQFLSEWGKMGTDKNGNIIYSTAEVHLIFRVEAKSISINVAEDTKDEVDTSRYLLVSSQHIRPLDIGIDQLAVKEIGYLNLSSCNSGHLDVSGNMARSF